jgi:hypothetical protein
MGFEGENAVFPRYEKAACEDSQTAFNEDDY